MSKKDSNRPEHIEDTWRKKARLTRIRKPLERSKAALRALLEFASDGIVVTESEGRILLVNAKTEEMFGYDREQLLGQTLEMLLPERLRDVHLKHRNSYFASPRSRPMGLGLDLAARRSDGAEFPVEISLSYIETDEGPVVMSFIIDITERKRAEDQLKALLEEKEILLKEVNHRVKNNLQAVTSLLYLQQTAARDEYVREIFRETQNRIKSIALVHEKLHPTGQRLQVNLADYVSSLVKQLIASYKTDPASISVQLKIGQELLDIETVVPLGIIINELVSNCLKHAFPQDQAGEIRVEVTKTEEDRLALVVSDNGIGFPEGKPARSEALGLQLVKMLAGHMQGTVEFERAAGTRIRVKFAPVPAFGD